MGCAHRLGDHSRRRLRVAFDLAGARRNAAAQEAGNRIRPPLILSHFLLAAGGLVVWIIYLISDNDSLAWIAFAILAVVAVLGFTMFAIWLRRRQAGTNGAEVATPGVPAEQHFPVSVVGLHGLLAVTTVVLVLLTALDVGELLRRRASERSSRSFSGRMPTEVVSRSCSWPDRERRARDGSRRNQDASKADECRSQRAPALYRRVPRLHRQLHELRRRRSRGGRRARDGALHSPLPRLRRRLRHYRPDRDPSDRTGSPRPAGNGRGLRGRLQSLR